RYYQDDVRDLKRPNVVDGPTVCPLFRDPHQRLTPAYPIDYQKLARFYTKLLGVTEERIFKKYGQKLKLITKNARGGLKWIVDLHSLRVSGITNLIEAGVPLEVVQMFVADHQVLVTTLHYLKYSPAKLRQYLEAAHDQMINNQDFVGSELFTEALMELAPFLLTQQGLVQGQALMPLCWVTGFGQSTPMVSALAPAAAMAERLKTPLRTNTAPFQEGSVWSMQILDHWPCPSPRADHCCEQLGVHDPQERIGDCPTQ
ncbi:site-specific integrase, partial [Pseudomonas sp. MAFF212428]|nr:site-specific integrase [Pseudomonas brassicae]